MIESRIRLARISRTRLGFSLMEVIFVMVIIGILLGITGISLTRTIDQEGPKGLAYALASDIRSARAEAQRSGRMVAVCFPSEAKTNSLSRTALLRKGDQRGHISRIFNYGDEYDATIFLGTWPGAMSTTTFVPLAWSVSTNKEIAIHFRADGSAFSNDLPAIDGNYPIVVGSSFQGTMNGPTGTLTHAKNAHTVWVSAAGSVDVDERTVPGGPLPVGESTLNIANLDTSGEPPPNAPTIAAARFFPSQIPGFKTSFIGQNYVNIHPNQKDTTHLEYGLASIEILADDSDGGPLTYTLEAQADSGADGKFTVSNLEGELRYVLVEDADLNNDGVPDPAKHYWRTVISWRPPHGAPKNVEYDLTVTVLDPQGNSAEISSTNGLIPKVSSLPPSRMVMCSSVKDLYITNLDGSNEVHVTKNGAEIEPFFSADGSRVFSFHEVTANERDLRSRPADGSVAFDKLATFSLTTTNNLIYDPTFTFAAVQIPGTQTFPWGRVVNTAGPDEPDNWVLITGSNTVDVEEVSIINLMSNDPPIPLGKTKPDSFQWGASQNRHSLSYSGYVETPLTSMHGFTFHPEPGYQDSGTQNRRISGYPPAIINAGGSVGTARGLIYNPADPDWYLKVSPDQRTLYLGNDVTSFQEPIATTSAAFQNNVQAHLTPTWSADGQRVTFVRDPGPSASVEVLQVLDSSHQWLGSTTPEFQRAEANLSGAQLSPEGDWVYYLKNGDIFRSDNVVGSVPVNISSHIGAKMLSYVISP